MDDKPHISNHQWERYSKKLLSEPEIIRMQEHVKICELCTDIKEGIDSMQSPEKLMVAVASLNKKVDDYLKPARNLNSLLLYWSAAAIVILSVGITWVMLNNNKNIVAEHQILNKESNEIVNDSVRIRGNDLEKINKEIKPNITETKPAVAEDLHGSSSGSMGQDSKSSGAETAAPQPELVNTDDATKAKDSYTAATTSNLPVKRKLDTLNNVDGMVATNTKNLDDEQDKMKVPMKVESESKESYASTESVQKATVVYKKAKSKKENTAGRASAEAAPARNADMNYTNTGKDSTFKNNNNAADLIALDSADYGAAVKNFETGNYDKCIQNLYYITINPNSNYYEEGLLLKAKTLLKQNKKEEAKVALNSLLLLNKTKREEAAELLKRIK